jgi:CheY-like chemotaxis protein
MKTRRALRNAQLVTQGGTPGMSASMTCPKVLLAEAQPSMRDVIGGRLRAVGCDVVELESGVALWAELESALADGDNPREPDLVISEIRPSGRDGIKVLSRLRAAGHSTPVILLSAFGTLGLVAEASQLGRTLVFRKPVELERLIAAAIRLASPAPAPLW